MDEQYPCVNSVRIHGEEFKPALHWNLNDISSCLADWKSYWIPSGTSSITSYPLLQRKNAPTVIDWNEKSSRTLADKAITFGDVMLMMTRESVSMVGCMY